MASGTPDPLKGAELDIQELKESEKLMQELVQELGSHMIDKFEKLVAEQPKKPFLIYDDILYTYEVVDSMANRVAHIARSWGLKARDCIAVNLENTPSFVWIFYGMQKLGVSVAFVNYNLRSHPLIHSILSVDCKALIVGAGEPLKAVTEILPQLGKLPVYAEGTDQQNLPIGVKSFDQLMQRTFPAPISPTIRSDITLDDTCCYIFTSGTTGNPKPCIISQSKAIWVSTASRYVSNAKPDDVVYCTLPLYHNTGCFMSVGAVLHAGATVVVKRKFSARQFWPDVRRYKVTILPYIGELLRYLLSQPKTDLDGVHNVRIVYGAGFRADIWPEFVERFKIPKVLEFYGMTEGHAVFVNWAAKPGAIGRLSPLMRKFDAHNKVFVKFDLATALPIRDENGRCIPVKIGEPGLFLSKVPDHLVDKKLYKASAETNEKRIVRDVFASGDIYMNYGDAMVQDKDFFVYFYDRLGDTFRWKGENVSTTEVANSITDLPFIEDANVFGVEIPGKDGKAGMAAVTLIGMLKLGNKELSDLYRHICKELPSYARPLFIRHIPQAVLTGTFKNRKVDLAAEGYDLTKVKDPIFFLDHENKTYSPFGRDASTKLLKSKL